MTGPDTPLVLSAIIWSTLRSIWVDVLRIFQARTSLILNRRASLDLLNELAQATAAVTATTGIFPRALVTTGEPAR